MQSALSPFPRSKSENRRKPEHAPGIDSSLFWLTTFCIIIPYDAAAFCSCREIDERPLLLLITCDMSWEGRRLAAACSWQAAQGLEWMSLKREKPLCRILGRERRYPWRRNSVHNLSGKFAQMIRDDSNFWWIQWAQEQQKRLTKITCNTPLGSSKETPTPCAIGHSISQRKDQEHLFIETAASTVDNHIDHYQASSLRLIACKNTFQWCRYYKRPLWNL